MMRSQSDVTLTWNRHQTPVLLSPNDPVTFEDIAVYFSEEEWKGLQEGHKELYREVIQDNYQNLTDLGLVITKPEIVQKIEKGEDPVISVCLTPAQVQHRAHSRPTYIDVAAVGSKHSKYSLRSHGALPGPSEQVRRLEKKQLPSPEEPSAKFCPVGWKPSQKSLKLLRKPPRVVMDTELGNHIAHGTLNQPQPENHTHSQTGVPGPHNSRKGIVCKREDISEETAHISGLSIGDGKPYRCARCGETWNNLLDFLSHEADSCQDRPYVCNICSKTFVKKQHLSSHRKIHTEERPFTCPQCGRSFRQSSTLTTHLWSHAGHKPFHCSCCTKRFSRKTDLVAHMRRHTGERPYECPYCWERFIRKKSLQRHMRKHSGESLQTIWGRRCATDTDGTTERNPKLQVFPPDGTFRLTLADANKEPCFRGKNEPQDKELGESEERTNEHWYRKMEEGDIQEGHIWDKEHGEGWKVHKEQEKTEERREQQHSEQGEGKEQNSESYDNKLEERSRKWDQKMWERKLEDVARIKHEQLERKVGNAGKEKDEQQNRKLPQADKSISESQARKLEEADVTKEDHQDKKIEKADAERNKQNWCSQSREAGKIRDQQELEPAEKRKNQQKDMKLQEEDTIISDWCSKSKEADKTRDEQWNQELQEADKRKDHQARNLEEADKRKDEVQDRKLQEEGKGENHMRKLSESDRGDFPKGQEKQSVAVADVKKEEEPGQSSPIMGEVKVKHQDTQTEFPQKKKATRVHLPMLRELRRFRKMSNRVQQEWDSMRATMDLFTQEMRELKEMVATVCSARTPESVCLSGTESHTLAEPPSYPGLNNTERTLALQGEDRFSISSSRASPESSLQYPPPHPLETLSDQSRDCTSWMYMAPSHEDADLLPSTTDTIQVKMEDEPEECTSPEGTFYSPTLYDECRIGDRLPNIPMLPISADREWSLLARSGGKAGRFAALVFRALVPFDIYKGWVNHVNLDGLRGRRGIPLNVKRQLMTIVERNFTLRKSDHSEIRNRLNEQLRTRRKSDKQPQWFF
ncbi:hypothetical protein XELAEV_18016553mg [Xenopus laevis]|nr:hypothetical protein XELAEV_18016553mg [Xenopus laevis]